MDEMEEKMEDIKERFSNVMNETGAYKKIELMLYGTTWIFKTSNCVEMDDIARELEDAFCEIIKERIKKQKTWM